MVYESFFPEKYKQNRITNTRPGCNTTVALWSWLLLPACNIAVSVILSDCIVVGIIKFVTQYKETFEQLQW
jgi:hypothetical protein